ncbi:MAG TPA: hypothetical protein VFV50_18495 [Bdellovibrionales bacterium]|nr:hypothetical protein [Bdellovibrionales bacterium]
MTKFLIRSLPVAILLVSFALLAQNPPRPQLPPTLPDDLGGAPEPCEPTPQGPPPPKDLAECRTKNAALIAETDAIKKRHDETVKGLESRLEQVVVTEPEKALQEAALAVKQRTDTRDRLRKELGDCLKSNKDSFDACSGKVHWLINEGKELADALTRYAQQLQRSSKGAIERDVLTNVLATLKDPKLADAAKTDAGKRKPSSKPANGTK